MNDAYEQRIVPFHGDELIAMQQADGTIVVVFGRVCDNLGLARSPQIRRIQRHEVLSQGLVMVTVDTEGGPQPVQCLRVDLLPLWMAGLQASRVDEPLRPKLVRYQLEAASVLWQAFRPQILVDPDATGEPTDSAAIVSLQHIAEMGRAITQMAEQHIELERKQQALDGRMNAAARIIKQVQGQVETVTGDLATMHVRLGVLETQVRPADTVSEAQAADIQTSVKALAEVLTRQDASKNHYQSIFAELYRRFNVSSYKRVRQDQYHAVLQFLDEWRAAHGA